MIRAIRNLTLGEILPRCQASQKINTLRSAFTMICGIVMSTEHRNFECTHIDRTSNMITRYFKMSK